MVNCKECFRCKRPSGDKLPLCGVCKKPVCVICRNAEGRCKFHGW